MIYATCSTYAKLWEIERNERYSTVKFSTSIKDKRTDEYVNSSWAFVRFIGEAHTKLAGYDKGDRIKITSFFMDNAPFMKEGVKTFPKSPKIVVTDFESVESGGGGKPSGKAPVDDMGVDDDSLPF